MGGLMVEIKLALVVFSVAFIASLREARPQLDPIERDAWVVVQLALLLLAMFLISRV